MEEEKALEKKNEIKINKIINILLMIGFFLVLFNQFQLSQLRSYGFENYNDISTGVLIDAEASYVLPKGVPRVYGQELGIKYDNVNANNQQLADQTINVLGNLDRTITLDGENLERYVDIVSDMSCEYCCGAESIIVTRKNVEDMNAKIGEAIATGKITREQAEQYRIKPGREACGCAHSYAMRGLAKYLISVHGAEFSDSEILEELGKWKTLFFPSQMTAKAQALKENGIEFNYYNLASNKFRGIEQGSATGSGMVGGC